MRGVEPAHLRVALAAADAAGAVILPLFRAAIGVQRKADDSPVTLADRQAEQAMRTLLADAFPSHGIHGEEYGLDNPGAAYRWVLDPIDGTRAFITGRPSFGTLVALLRDGVPILGIIDQPVTGERWVGIAGEPTRFSGPFGGTPRTRACPSLAAAELSSTSPEHLEPDTAAWRRLAGQVARTSWGGDCYAYGLLALGQIDIVAECGLKPWDWAALVPVVEGAGGCIRDWSGNSVTLEGDGRLVALGDPSLLQPVVQQLSSSVRSQKA